MFFKGMYHPWSFSSLFCFSSSCVPSRFQTPTDSLVLKEGQSSSTQEELIQASPAAAPPLSVHQREEPIWLGGVRPPFGADSSNHMHLDSLQVPVFLMLMDRRVFLSEVHQMSKNCISLVPGHFKLSVTFPLPRMLQCTQLGSSQSGATSSFSIITSLFISPILCRSTSTEDGSGRVGFTKASESAHTLHGLYSL